MTALPAKPTSAPLAESFVLDRLEFAERALAAALDPAVLNPAALDPDVLNPATVKPVANVHHAPVPNPILNPAANLASLLLVVSAQSTTLDDGRWQFAIETAAGDPILEAEDWERGDLNRLTLLAAVRGLEAIDGPSGVTLLSHNRYLIRSLTDSLPRWRRSDFVWDHFGRRVEVQHADLWRRIDHALGIHEVQACLLTARMVSRPDVMPSKNSLTVPATANLSTCTHLSPENTLSNRSTSDERRRIEASRLGSSMPHTGNRLRDWLLQSAVDTSHRAQRIAMIGHADA